MTVPRRRAIGAEIVDGGVHFRVWAPAQESVSVVIDGNATALEKEPRGYFSGVVKGGAGTRYKFRLEDGDYPDPASRYQPDGPHGESVVVDPGAYEWRAEPPRIDDPIISEIHIGTFTPEGTFAAAIEKLPLLADAGINVLEIMPVNEFAGTFGWGYDGVDLWAPARLYGEPDDFRRFVDAAHGHGLAVILDVVYNHFGPDGCYVSKYTPLYFTKKYDNEWGDAINFDEESVCEFFAENAAYWIDELRLDGLRVDATQSMLPNDVIADITRGARAAADRPIYITAENEPQDRRLVKELGIDALWNDDWHHSAQVALTGFREAYYHDYLGRPQEFVSMARLGFLYQGQWYAWQKQPRGTPSRDFEPRQLICYLQNHDQIANSARGERIDRLTSPAKLKAMTALLLLSPNTPLLFQGQEFAASAPFLYFADHGAELAELVAKGRREFLEEFPSIDTFIAPHDPETFRRCKLDWSERDSHKDAVDFHRELIRLRRTMPKSKPEGAVLGEHSFLLRWFADPDRLLIIHLGEGELVLDPKPEPLLAPPAQCEWQTEWTCGSATLFTARARRPASSSADAADRKDRDRAS